MEAIRNDLTIAVRPRPINMLQSRGPAPQRLEVEITEGTIMKDPVHESEILTRLREMGIRISIDDFGTGYSSLPYLSNLPVNEIKIDKSFVMNMTTDESAAVIVRSTIDLARQFGLSTVAEGVENQDALDRLEAPGCDSAQGYYISHPVNPAELVDWRNRFPSHTRISA